MKGRNESPTRLGRPESIGALVGRVMGRIEVASTDETGAGDAAPAGAADAQSGAGIGHSTDPAVKRNPALQGAEILSKIGRHSLSRDGEKVRCRRMTVACAKSLSQLSSQLLETDCTLLWLVDRVSEPTPLAFTEVEMPQWSRPGCWTKTTGKSLPASWRCEDEKAVRSSMAARRPLRSGGAAPSERGRLWFGNAS